MSSDPCDQKPSIFLLLRVYSVYTSYGAIFFPRAFKNFINNIEWDTYISAAIKLDQITVINWCSMFCLVGNYFKE